MQLMNETFHCSLALAWLPGEKETFINQSLIQDKYGNYFCKVPNSMVEDAVEVVWNDRVYKRLDPALDAGWVTVEAGSKSGLGIRRKVQQIVDGRKVLHDTNNSTEDFDHDVVPVPRYFEIN